MAALVGLPAVAQQATGAGGDKSVGGPTASGTTGDRRVVRDFTNTRVPPPRYATELPSQRLAADGEAEDLVASSETSVPAVAPARERLAIDAPVMIDDIEPTEHKEFEVEIGFDWSTEKFGRTKDIDTGDTVLYNTYEITYGLLPNLEVGLEVPIDIGDGRVEGNGDIELLAKYRLWEDKDWYPGFAIGTAIRLPTGVDSSGVDGEFTFILTKGFGLHRVHLNGMLKTANGNNVEDLRHFQWSVGVGYDHPIIDDRTLFIADYLLRSSEEEGNGNVNLLEVGIQREIAEHHTIGASIRVGLDDHEETPDVGVGVKYVFGMK